MEDTELRKALETLFFITDHPLPPERVAQLCEIKDQERVKSAIAALKDHLDQNGSALQLMQIAGGWQMATRPENGLWVRKLYHNKMTVRLSQAAIETLCIIAYRQPITRAEVESIRGVEVIGPLDTLSERKLITVVGRRETVGRPILYGTTGEFLRQFGLNSLDDLPKLENIPVDVAPHQLVPAPEPAQPVLFEEAALAAPQTETGLPASAQEPAMESATEPAPAPETSVPEMAPESAKAVTEPAPEPAQELQQSAVVDASAEEPEPETPVKAYEEPVIEPVAEGSTVEVLSAGPQTMPAPEQGQPGPEPVADHAAIQPGEPAPEEPHDNN